MPALQTGRNRRFALRVCDAAMRAQAPARSWPSPSRCPGRRTIGVDEWNALAVSANLEPQSKDARSLIAKVRELLGTMSVTLDGRLVSEAIPRATEIVDPLTKHAIPGALAVLKYLADMDAASMEQLLGDSWEAAERQLGFPGSSSRAHRDSTLLQLAIALNVFLPAMSHCAGVAAGKIAGGRPPSNREESEQIVVELRTIWAEHAEGDEKDFYDFVVGVFEIARSVPPSKELVGSSRSALPDSTTQDAAQLAGLRAAARERRSLIAGRCKDRGILRGRVSVMAQNGRAAARALGCEDEGPTAQWRAQVAQAAKAGDAGPLRPSPDRSRPRQGAEPASGKPRARTSANASSRTRVKKR